MGLAMTALEVHVRHYPLPAMYDGVASGTHYDGYLLQVGYLFKAEPGFKPGIDWVVSTMTADGDYAQPVVVLDALEYVADSTDIADPRVELLLARSSRALGDPVQSLRRIQDYLSEGGDLGVARLEQARSLAWMGAMDSAAAAYLEGAQVRSPATRQAYEGDIAWVASPQELASFEQLPRRFRRRVHRVLLAATRRAIVPARRHCAAGTPESLGVCRPALSSARSGVPGHVPASRRYVLLSSCASRLGLSGVG